MEKNTNTPARIILNECNNVLAALAYLNEDLNAEQEAVFVAIADRVVKIIIQAVTICHIGNSSISEIQDPETRDRLMYALNKIKSATNK